MTQPLANPGSFTWMTPAELADPKWVAQYPGLEHIKETDPTAWASLLHTAGVAQSLGANPAGTPPPDNSSPLGTTAVGAPFAGLKGWLVGFGALAAVVAFASDSPTYRPLALAVLGLVVVSYVFASWSNLVDEFNTLFGSNIAGGSQ